MWVVVPLWLGGAAGLAFGINAFLRGREDLVGADAPAIEVTKIVLTLVGVVGAVFAGVYAYRKQLLEEGASHRADAAAFADRYNSASGQLGHEKAAVRLAGVYAMARLADDWPEQQQVCVDVLCAYLRMPVKEDDPPPGEAEVRSTVVSVIRAHLLATAPVSWSDKNFDFTGAVLHNANLREVIFAGSTTTFDGALFTGKWTSFDRAQFTGMLTTFNGAQFTGERTWFDGAQFAGEWTSFNWAQFTGARTSFDWAQFTGEWTSFDRAQFTGMLTTFNGAQFTGEWTSFDRVQFTGARTSFNWAQFTGARTSFDWAQFTGETTWFDGAQFTGARTSFDWAQFTGETTSFDGAIWDRVKVTFDDVTIGPQTLVTGFDNPTLSEGATITANGKPFTGQPKPPDPEEAGAETD